MALAQQVPDAAVQLARGASVQRQATACGRRGNIYRSDRDQLIITLPRVATVRKIMQSVSPSETRRPLGQERWVCSNSNGD